MAENKKGFILYADQIDLFSQLPNEKAGELIKHIFAYVNDGNPQTDDLIINLAFTPIKQQLKRDLQKFEQTKKQRSEAGKRSAELRKKQRDSTKATSVERTSTKATVTDNVNVTVTDKVITNTNTSQPTAEGIDFIKLLLLINETTGRNFKVINNSLKSKFKARLKDGYTKEDIKNCIINSIKDQFHKDNNFKYLKPEYYSRANTLDQYAFKKIKTVGKHLENPYKSQLKN